MGVKLLGDGKYEGKMMIGDLEVFGMDDRVCCDRRILQSHMNLLIRHSIGTSMVNGVQTCKYTLVQYISLRVADHVAPPIE